MDFQEDRMFFSSRYYETALSFDKAFHNVILFF
jgi:hypothetical protein